MLVPIGIATEEITIERIRARYEALKPVLDERQCRLWAAAEAVSLGRGGIAAVTKATGILSKRIIAGIRDLRTVDESGVVERPRAQRIRRPGAGRSAAKNMTRP